MENNNVLNDRKLHNCGINQKDCKFCVYNCENGCSVDQSLCWCCDHKLFFKPLKNSSEFNFGLEFKKFSILGKGYLSPARFLRYNPLLSIQTDLTIALVKCTDESVLEPLSRAYIALSNYIKNAD